MPIYLYQHPHTEEVIEVVQKMTEPHVYKDENGLEYIRIYANPLMAVDTKMDPFSKNDFLRRTNKKMTVGDMMDESSELSRKRESVAGIDPVKQKVFDNYKKKTGKDHPENKPKRIETKNAILEF